MDKADVVFEKLAKIFGEHVHDYISSSPQVSVNDNMPAYRRYVEAKAIEPKSSIFKTSLGYGAALGTMGGIIGAANGINPALPAAVGLTFGATIGAFAKAIDDNEIDKAQGIVESSNFHHELKQHLIKELDRHHKSTVRDEYLIAERRHQELLNKL